MLEICRLCLSQDRMSLYRIAEVLNSSLTAETAWLFTGIQIETFHWNTHFICTQCTNTLEKCEIFRKSCINNNYIFQQLYRRTRPSCRHVKAVEEAYDIDTDPLQVEFVVPEKAAGDLLAYDEIASTDHEVVEWYEQPNAAKKTVLNDDGDLQTASSTETHEELYSANYIELGELRSEDDEVDLLQNDSLTNKASEMKSGKKHCRSLSRTKPAGGDAGRANESRIPSRRTKRKPEIALCDTCGKTVSNLATHSAIHTAEHNNACPYCSIKMKLASNLIRHIQAVHLKKAVKTCTECNVGFTHYTTYRSHLYSQHGIGKIHECHECSRRFADACMLRKHNKRYHSLQKFPCGTCGKIFKMREQLKRHSIVHTDEHPYVCSQCPKRFKSTKNRNVHELLHKGVMHKCSFCEKSFRFKYLVNSHIRKMHPDASNEMETRQEETFCRIVN